MARASRMDWTVFVILMHCLVMDPVTTTTSSPQQSNEGSICESNINRHKNTCYWLERVHDTFDNMRARCASKGGTLAAVDSKETSIFVLKLMNTIGMGWTWIGYKEPSDRWDDGSRFSWTNYAPDYPRADAGWNCLMMFPSHPWEWGDLPCRNKYYGLCQISILKASECLQSYQGSEYRGNVSVTQDGLTCQAWAEQEPHEHDYTDPSLFPDETLEDASNHCRNPDNRPEGPWCYTTDTSAQWGFCDIPSCFKNITMKLARKLRKEYATRPKPQECLVSTQGSEYVGHRSVTASNRTCQAWRAKVPTAHSYTNPDSFPDSTLKDAANYCRMPAGSDLAVMTRPWCYTTDPDVPWEHCDIPMCASGAANKCLDSSMYLQLLVHLLLAIMAVLCT